MATGAVAKTPEITAPPNVTDNGADAENLDETLFDGIGVVERVMLAADILKDTNIGKVHDDLKLRLTVPLYTKTALTRQEDEQAEAESAPEMPGSSAQAKARHAPATVAPAAEPYSTDEVVKKNLYYLASLLQNFNQVLIELVQHGVLRLEEKDNIVDQNATKGDSFLKHLLLFCSLSRINGLQFVALINILRGTENDEAADLLELVNIPPVALRAAANLPAEGDAGSPAAVTRKRIGRRSIALAQPAYTNLANQTMQDIEIEEPATWACLVCTYKNTPGTGRCGICETPNSEDESMLELEEDPLRHCQQCTYINAIGSQRCDMCDAEICLVRSYASPSLALAEV